MLSLRAHGHKIHAIPRPAPFTAYMQPGWLRLETGSGHQQNGADCHQENARPVRSESQESHAAPWRLQSVANRAGGFRATKRSPPNSTACQVQESAENEQRAESHQEHSRLSIHRCPAQDNGDSTLQVRKRSGLTSAAVVRSSAKLSLFKNTATRSQLDLARYIVK